MIILDLQQVMIATLAAQLGSNQSAKLEVDLLRHMIINKIRADRKQFTKEFGELVIACDSRASWRRKVFPYYKARRREAREASTMDWATIFDAFDSVKAELREFFPYRVIQVEGAEADDIIGVLATEFGSAKNDSEFGDLILASEKPEPVLILSGDKDFVQLQVNKNVRQYNPVMKKWVVHPNPAMALVEHIIRGDAGDGVPNIRSADNSLALGIRQKPIKADYLEKLATSPDPESLMTESERRGFARNRQMIDLAHTPAEIRAEILANYHAEAGKDRSKLMNYMIKFRMKHLLQDLNDF